jgi:UDP-N-acetylmuramoyl-tripeptide--D-alanyl-D-alanine ligase
MTAGEVARDADGSLEGDADALITSWSFDSRSLERGACFVALRGDRDGHDYVAAAFEAGARVALIDREIDGVRLNGHGALVRVADTLAALQRLARTARAVRSDVRVVGVAGSTGKTSTKDLLAATLASIGCHANPESYNNEFGVPITLLNTPPAARVVVAEMGERFHGDVAALAAIARPEIGVVTNVGLAHAEHLGGPEGVAEVLAELMDALPPHGLAVLSADDEWTPPLAKRTRADVVTVGFDKGADFRIAAVDLDDELRPSFSLHGQRFTVPLHGAHHVLNAAMAIAVASRAFSLPLEEIAALLSGARRGRWRMELLESADGVVVLNDAYNANPASMEAALVALAHLPVPGRRIAVLGDMRELGDHATVAHTQIGRRLGALGIDVVVGVGRGGAVIAGAATGAVDEVRTVVDASEASAVVGEIVAPGDAVLVKASRAIGLETVAHALVGRGNDA